jgi:hypothetical protein
MTAQGQSFAGQCLLPLGIEAFKAPIARTICSGAVLSSAAIAKNRATPISTQVMCHLPAKLLRPKAVQIVNRPGPPDDRAGRPRPSSKLGWVAGSACRTDLAQTRPLRWSARGQRSASVRAGSPPHREIDFSDNLLRLARQRRDIFPQSRNAGLQQHNPSARGDRYSAGATLFVPSGHDGPSCPGHFPYVTGRLGPTPARKITKT